jgi:hypothetical protein
MGRDWLVTRALSVSGARLSGPTWKRFWRWSGEPWPGRLIFGGLGKGMLRRSARGQRGVALFIYALDWSHGCVQS